MSSSLLSQCVCYQCYQMYMKSSLRLLYIYCSCCCRYSSAADTVSTCNIIYFRFSRLVATPLTLPHMSTFIHCAFHDSCQASNSSFIGYQQRSLPLAGFSALVPDNGMFNVGKSDRQVSQQSLFMSSTHDSPNIICKEYLLYNDEVNQDTGIQLHVLMYQSC